ncbi:MAG TPA: hypothetical protein VGL70_08900 [Candidatus Binatia bacterium]|jgi:hypothetical protein
MAIPDANQPRAPTARRLRFLLGVALIAVSFTVYLAYFVIVLFLPYSAEAKVGVIVAASLVSWAGFSLGIFLAGHEGYHWIKRACARRNASKSVG